jgi:negative regulator of sigma E activity
MKPATPGDVVARDVMAAYDGELASDEAGRVLREPRARALHAGLEQLGSAVREAYERRLPDVDLTDRIFERIAREELAAPGASQSKAEPVPVPIAERRERRRGWRSARAYGAFAAAAALTLALGSGVGWLRFGSASLSAQAPAGGTRMSASAGVSAGARLDPEGSVSGPGLAASEAEEPAAVAIETVDFGERGGTIFMVPAADGHVTPVVWLEDAAGPSQATETL